MKTIIRNTAIYTLALYFLPSLIPGVKIDGGFITLLVGGLALALMFLILRPILHIISFPINLLTLGVSSIFTNALILYLLTIFVVDISIVAFTYQATNIWGFGIPTIQFNTFFAYLYTSFILSLIDSSISWLVE